MANTLSHRRKQQLLASAERHCQHQQVRLTAQRRQVLALLLDQTEPQTAYQLLDQFKVRHQAGAQPPTIYRALEFLVQQGLAHRLRSTNQYLACEHLTCDHGHQDTVFLLCDDCGQVQEQPLAPTALANLQDAVSAQGFTPYRDSPLELRGRCQHCATAR